MYVLSCVIINSLVMRLERRTTIIHCNQSHLWTRYRTTNSS